MAPTNVAEASKLLQSIIQEPSESSQTAKLSSYVSEVLDESPTTARPLLDAFISTFEQIPSANVKVNAGRAALEAIAPNVVSFEEQDRKLRQALATVYEAQNENAAAAEILARIQLDSSQTTTSDDEKVEIWVRIMRNLLEDDETVEAERWLNRAKNVIYKVTDPSLKIHFQTSEARILDSQRKFLQASEKYHTLSFSSMVTEDDRLQCLSQAIICAVLAPAGPQRSRNLASLYKDERSKELPADYSILEKMFLDRLLSPAEVDQFAQRLAPHQVAKTDDGSTVLAKAVIEHNLLGASKLYENISINSLGELLGLPGSTAEGYAARMIEQRRVAGRIDQIDGLIYFEAGTGEISNGTEKLVVGREIKRFDENVGRLAEQVERVATMLTDEVPNLVPVA